MPHDRHKIRHRAHPFKQKVTPFPLPHQISSLFPPLGGEGQGGGKNRAREGGIGILYGVGIGPGDPELMTLKAVKALREADVIFAPVSGGDSVSCARRIIRGVVGESKRIIGVEFPMTKDKKTLRAHWRKAAASIAHTVNAGRTAAFVTIGDPLIYSTYIYLLRILRRDYPEIKTMTIPGISAFNAAGARLQMPLVEGDETMAVLPAGKDPGKVRKFLREFDTVVLMKVGVKLESIRRILREMKLLKNAVLVSRVGHPDETVVEDISSLEGKEAGYLSVIIVKKDITSYPFPCAIAGG